MSFCKDFNAKTSEHKAETPVPVVIEIYGDKTFEWTMKTPPTSYFVARAAGVKTCSRRRTRAALRAYQPETPRAARSQRSRRAIKGWGT